MNENLLFESMHIPLEIGARLKNLFPFALTPLDTMRKHAHYMSFARWPA